MKNEAMNNKLMKILNKLIDDRCWDYGAHRMIADLLTWGMTADEIINELDFDERAVHEVVEAREKNPNEDFEDWE